jgi:hypothetical protein
MSNFSLVKIKNYNDDRGNILIFENGNNLNFDVKRVYLLKDIPLNKERGHHAHIKLKQLMIALSGSVTIEVTDLNSKKSFLLSSPEQGLYISGPTWRVLKDFSPDCILMVIASDYFDPNDYIDDYALFMKAYNF